MRALAGVAAPDLNDLVQIAAEQVFRSLSTFDGRSDLMTWVYAICYRVLLRERSWYRRWQLQLALFQQEPSASEGQALPSARLEAAERRRQLHLAIARMSDKYRVVIMLRDIEELEIQQIAEIVGANELTVRSRLRDGRKQLLKLLRADGSFDAWGEQHELTQT